jgi:16S rRNA (adenine1518-N6/adenine1519-N6)-dimethyltransferase
MLCQDALRNKNNVHPAVIDAVSEKLAAIPGSRLKLVANLPYSIATPIISNLLSTEVTPVLMTVTIQKELADRIVARPSTKDYSALSVWVQSQCRAQILRVMPPEAFWPRPKVNSAIVQIIPDPELKARIHDVAFFHSFVRSLFFHRRKLLRSELLSACQRQLDKPAIDRLIAEMGLSAQSRAEELDVATMLKLSATVQRRLVSLA